VDILFYKTTACFETFHTYVPTGAGPFLPKRTDEADEQLKIKLKENVVPT
jgi:hypothetical protein